MINVRSKGLNFERYIANELKEFYPNARRHLEYHMDDCKGYDLDNTGHFKIQCKRNKKYCSVNKIEEVQVQSDDEIPMLITKGDHKKPVVCLYLEDFKKILRKPSDF